MYALLADTTHASMAIVDVPADLHGEGTHLSRGVSMMRDLSVMTDKVGASGRSRRPHEGNLRQWFAREI